MTKFKVGDRVRRTSKHPHMGVRTGDEAIISAISENGACLALIGHDSLINRYPFSAAGFELATSEKLLPLTFVLRMDREIAKAGGSPGLLEDYLDRPLNEFVQNVMIPNSLTLQFNS